MAQSFVTTLRALEENRGRGAWLGLLGLLVLLAALITWFIRARVTLYEVSRKTHVEVRGASAPIHSVVSGQLASVEVSLGQTVQAGDVLFRLDSAVEEHGLRRVRARLAALEPQIAAAQNELQALLDVIKAEQSAGWVATQEARAHDREARIQASLADSEARRLGQVAADISAVELERARATAQMRKASSEAAVFSVLRQIKDRNMRRKTGEVRAAEIRRELAVLLGEQQALLANVAELEQIIARTVIRAPSRGQIGELVPIHRGSFVAQGAKLATLTPIGELMLVAEFEPAAALGRIRPGQPAQLRLSGFPWLEFGVVPARVSKVAGEVHDQTIRVELDLLQAQSSLIPFQTGLPGTVEVAVERISPATLLLRSLGQRLTADGT